MAAPQTRHLSILLTDIKGFTDKTSNKTRADIQTMLDEHRSVVLPILENGGGRLIKTIGDAFLMTFESPTNAVLAGVAVQEALTKLNEGRSPDDRLEIRIAINSGEINLVDGDVFGEPVNITARIEGIAEAGQVYFTEAVYLAMNKAEVPSAEVGLMQLKGIPEKIRVYKVRREEPVGAASSAAPDRKGFRRFLPPPASAPAVFGPGVKAIPLTAMTLPSSRRRAVALLIDAAICSAILSSFVGSRGTTIHFKKAPPPAAAPAATTDDKGANFSAGNSKVRFDDKGVHGNAGDTNIALDASGFHVTKAKPQKTLFQTKSGVTASVDADSIKDEDDDGSLLRGLMNGAWDFAIVWGIYNLLFLKWLQGGSPGKKLMKLQVVSQNGAPLEKRQRFVRALVSIASMHVFFIGYLWALWEPQRRTWHDLMAGTRVVPAE